MYCIDKACFVIIPRQSGTGVVYGPDRPCLSRGVGTLGRYRPASSAVISLTADLASPKSIAVFGSK
jgi:hypothetical protein